MADRIRIDTGVLEDLQAQIEQIKSSLTDIAGDVSLSVSEVRRVASDQTGIINKVDRARKNTISTADHARRLATAVRNSVQRWEEAEQSIAVQKKEESESPFGNSGNGEASNRNGNQGARLMLGDSARPLGNRVQSFVNVAGASGILGIGASANKNTGLPQSNLKNTLSDKEAEEMIKLIFGSNALDRQILWIFGDYNHPEMGQLKDLLTGKTDQYDNETKLRLYTQTRLQLILAAEELSETDRQNRIRGLLSYCQSKAETSPKDFAVSVLEDLGKDCGKDFIGNFITGTTDDLSFSPDDLAAFIVSSSTLASITQTNDARYILNALDILENPSPDTGNNLVNSMYNDVREQANTAQIGRYAKQQSESGGTKTQAFARALYALKP